MRNALAVLTLLATLAFVGSVFVAGPFEGFEAQQLPIPQTDPPVQPAGWAFAIWGAIYAWLIVSALFGLRKRGDDPEWDRVRIPLIVSLLVGTPWLWVAQRSPVAAVALLFVMAGAAIAALGRAPVWDRWELRAPVALYAGWLSAASFVALGAVLAGYGILLGPVGWAVVCIAGALLVAVWVATEPPGAPVYVAAVAWALFGIAVKNRDAVPSVAALAALGVALLAVVAIVTAARQRDY